MLVGLSDSRRALEDRLYFHQLGRLDAGVRFHRLRTIAGILQATGGLDRQQRAKLDLLGPMLFAVYGGGAKQQLGEGKVEQSGEFLAGPVDADLGQSLCNIKYRMRRTPPASVRRGTPKNMIARVVSLMQSFFDEQSPSAALTIM